MTGEYYATNGLNDLTRIGSFHYPGCTPVGNGTLSGTVTDGANPIAGATVSLGSRTTTTDGSGDYSFTRPGRHVRVADRERRPGSTRRRPRRSSSPTAVRRRGTSRSARPRRAAASPTTRRPTSSAAPRPTATSSRVPGSVVLAAPDNTDAQNSDRQPDRLRHHQHRLGRPDVHADRHRARSSASTSSSSAPAARRTVPNVTLSIRTRPDTTPCRPAPTSRPRRSPASTTAAPAD